MFGGQIGIVEEENLNWILGMVIEIFRDLEEDIIWNCEESFNICEVYEDNQYWIIIIKSGDWS